MSYTDLKGVDRLMRVSTPFISFKLDKFQPHPSPLTVRVGLKFIPR